MFKETEITRRDFIKFASAGLVTGGMTFLFGCKPGEETDKTGAEQLQENGESKDGSLRIQLSLLENNDNTHKVCFYNKDWPKGRSGIIDFFIDQDPPPILASGGLEKAKYEGQIWTRCLELSFLPTNLEKLSGSILARDRQATTEAPDYEYKPGDVVTEDIAMLSNVTLPVSVKLDLWYDGRDRSYLIEFKPSENSQLKIQE